MDYTFAERDRYNNMWRSLRGEFHKDKNNYKSKYPSSDIIDNFLKTTKIRKGNVLDVGCGNARNSIYFAKRGFNVKAIDFSEEGLKLAKKNVKENKINVSIEKRSVFDLEDVNKYDVVIDFGLFHHLRKSEWNKYMNKVHRVLKKDGFYLLHCFSSNSKRLKPKNRNWLLINKHYDHFFDMKEINKIFKDKLYIKGKVESEKDGLFFWNVYAQKI